MKLHEAICIVVQLAQQNRISEEAAGADGPLAAEYCRQRDAFKVFDMIMEGVKISKKLQVETEQPLERIQDVLADKMGILILGIQGALGTEETGDALIQVARNAHQAEQEVAAVVRWNNQSEDVSVETTQDNYTARLDYGDAGFWNVTDGNGDVIFALPDTVPVSHIQRYVRIWEAGQRIGKIIGEEYVRTNIRRAMGL